MKGTPVTGEQTRHFIRNSVENNPRMLVRRSAAAVAVVALCFQASHSHAAGSFAGPVGIEGRWAMEVTVGASTRMKDADQSLIFIGNGGTASSGTVDDGNLNYKKGDVISAVAKAVGEVELKKDNYGLFVRAKAFSDFHNQSTKAPHGSSANGYIPNQVIDDRGFEKGTKFEDAQFLDAYAYADFEPFGKPLTVKFGNQVVTWGEALFVLGGTNQYSNFDSAALRRPGVQLKEVFLPLPQIYANIQAFEGLSIESFVQLNHEKVVVDGCGNYFSAADLLNCNFQGSPINPGVANLGGLQLDFSSYNDRQSFSGGGTFRANGTPVDSTAGGNATNTAINTLLGAAGFNGNVSNLNFRMAQRQDRRAKDDGQIGIAGRYYASSIGTEIGVYAINYHQRIPNLGLVKTPSNFTGSLFQGICVGGSTAPGSTGACQINPLSYFFDYGVENIKVFGTSAATELGGFSLFGEISYTKGLPVGYNTTDLIKGAGTGTGPLARYFSNTAFPIGSRLDGFKQLDKLQMQMSTIKLFPRRLGAASIGLVAEVGAQFWNGIEDPYTGERFGRSPAFGAGAHQSYDTAGNSPAPCASNPATNTVARNCTTDGYATKSAFGYRALVVANYPDALYGVTLAPRVFFSHDVKGFSADGVFLEDRMNLGLGVRAEIQSARYFAEMNYSLFNPNAYFDPFKDRDFLSLVLGANL